MRHRMSTHVVLIICLFTCFIRQNVIYGFLKKSKADIYPKDALVFVGESLRLTCVLQDSVQASVADVHFKIVSFNNTLNWPVPREDYVISDNRTVSVTVKVNEQFTQRTTVECKGGEGALFTSCYIYVERSIRNITNLSAYYLYKHHVNITWSINRNYMSQSDIGVVVGWSSETLQNKSSAKWMPCNVSSWTHCAIYEPEHPKLYVFRYIYVRITVYSKRWDKRPKLEYLTPVFSTNATSEYRIFIHDATKCGPPVNLTCVSHNSTCVNLSWTHPEYLKYSDTEAYGIVTSFYYNMTCWQGDSHHLVVMVSDRYTTRSLPLTICNLIPFTNYTTSVQLRLEEMQPWSEWSSVLTQTDEDKPLTGPPMAATSFYDSGCSKNKRDVYLYWQKPDPISLQGSLVGYEIRVTSSSRVTAYTAPPAANHYKLESLECDVSYHISVFTATRVGRSLAPSVVLVSRYNKELFSDIDLKIEEVNNMSLSQMSRRLNIAWRALDQENTTLVFYRCRESNPEYTCSNEVDITEVNASQGFLNLENVDVKDDLFGYALKLTSGLTDGIRWEKCVYHRDAKTSRVSNIRVISGASQGSLDIFWFIEPCRVTKPLVQYFTVFVCDTEEKITSEICRQYNVSDGTQSVTVDSLPDGGEYNVSIRAMTPVHSGERIGFVTGKTASRRTDAVSPRVIIVTSFIITGAVFLCALIIYCYTMCRKSRGKFSKITSLLSEDTAGSSVKVNFNNQDSEESSNDADISSMLDNERNDWLNGQSFTKTASTSWSSATMPPSSVQLVTDPHNAPPTGYARMANNTRLDLTLLTQPSLSANNISSRYHWLHAGEFYQNRLTLMDHFHNDNQVLQCQFSKNSNHQHFRFTDGYNPDKIVHECGKSESFYSQYNLVKPFPETKVVKTLTANQMKDYITTHYLDYVVSEPGLAEVFDYLNVSEAKAHRDGDGSDDGDGYGIAGAGRTEIEADTQVLQRVI